MNVHEIHNVYIVSTHMNGVKSVIPSFFGVIIFIKTTSSFWMDDASVNRKGSDWCDTLSEDHFSFRLSDPDLCHHVVSSGHNELNSLWSGDGTLHSRSKLIQILTFCLFIPKPLFDLVLLYCQLDPTKHMWVKFWSFSIIPPILFTSKKQLSGQNSL